ncbi:hypothetical protein Y032_0023g858 [Ancylostoma ceylanicum]|uniref:Uncharacterized protein n=1 Tax=Ancylostoma ceylanicum TaxID=53326 RepID=A0A016UXG6_9BILA|nr:hypothetical protein Y032_0023g858 [Ancylostoma ceylanicum]
MFKDFRRWKHVHLRIYRYSPLNLKSFTTLSTRIRMDPLCVLKVDVWQQKFLGKEWKPYVAAVFAESEFGKARIELFNSPKKVKSMEPSKIILLDQCVSIKIPNKEGDNPYIRLQMKDDAELRLRSDHLSQLMSSISSAAFPKKYVTIAPSTSMESSSSENDDTQFYDQYPVLLVPSTLTTKRNLAEGNYSLRFCDELIALIHGNVQVQHFPYHDILWAAVGENSLGIAVENCGVYEFICDQPLLIIDHMRNYIRFKNSFPAVRLNTKRKYNRFYHQAREVTTSASDLSHASTLESQGSSKASVVQCDRHLPPVVEDRVMEKVTEPQEAKSVKVKVAKEKVAKEGLFSGLFRKGSRKKAIEGVRTDFEENADSEWLRLPVPPKCLNGSEQKKESERWKDQPAEQNCYSVVDQSQCASNEALHKQEYSKHRHVGSAGIGR